MIIGKVLKKKNNIFYLCTYPSVSNHYSPRTKERLPLFAIKSILKCNKTDGTQSLISNLVNKNSL